MVRRTKTAKISLLMGLALLPILAFQNCSEVMPGDHDSSSSAAIGGPATYAIIQSQAMMVLRNRCASCHNPVDGESVLIPNILDIRALSEDGYITMGIPHTSPLYLAVVDGLEPRESERLPANEIEILRKWLLGGDIDDSIGGGDEEGEPAGPPLPATFANVRDNVLASCLACHGTNGPQAPLVTYAQVRAFVIPNNPGASDLWQRVSLNTMPPPPRPAVTAPNKTLLFNWIQAGAPNN